MVSAVFLRDIVDHLLPSLHAEIHIDVWEGNSIRIEKPFEEEVVGKRVQLCNPERVGHQATCGRPASWSNWDAPGAGKLHDVPHDQEIAGEAHGADGEEFGPQASFILRLV